MRSGDPFNLSSSGPLPTCIGLIRWDRCPPRCTSLESSLTILSCLKFGSRGPRGLGASASQRAIPESRINTRISETAGDHPAGLRRTRESRAASAATWQELTGRRTGVAVGKLRGHRDCAQTGTFSNKRWWMPPHPKFPTGDAEAASVCTIYPNQARCEGSTV